MQKIDYMDITTAVPLEKIKSNILDARKRNITPISSLLSWREGRAIALIGGGPSLSSHKVDILSGPYEEIIIAGSAHDYFVKRMGIDTKDKMWKNIYCIVCDPDPIMSEYLTLHNSNITYLLASQCSKEVFDLFKDREVYIWDATGREDLNNELFQDISNHIPGGCTIGTRAIMAAIGMGYKKLHLFGYDSCVYEDKHHAYEFLHPDKEILGDLIDVKLDHPDSPTFKAAGYMLAQLFDFQNLLKTYATNLNIEIFGGGLLAECLRIGKLRATEQLEKEKIHG